MIDYRIIRTRYYSILLFFHYARGALFYICLTQILHLLQYPTLCTLPYYMHISTIFSLTHTHEHILGRGIPRNHFE